MRLVFRAASRAAVSVCVLGLASASPGQAMEPGDPSATSVTTMLAAVTAPLLAANIRALQAHAADFSSGRPIAPAQAKSAGTAFSLEDLVDRNATAEAGSEDDKCLAASVYYESQGEPLRGQLAVAQTILNRALSGRFADSICGVLRQPGQFSFIHRGGHVPTPSHAGGAWTKAVAIARIARAGLWHQIAPAALYFHARSVSPGWGRVQVASIGHHIFFR